MVITAHYSELQTLNLHQRLQKVSTTLLYPQCWVVTTSSIAGLQGNSIKYHELDKDGTQKVLAGCFNLLHDAHHSWGFMVLGVTLRY